MVTNTRPPPPYRCGHVDTLERNPRPEMDEPATCRNCGSGETRLKGDGTTVCAYCRTTRAAQGRLVEVTTLADAAPRYVPTNSRGPG